MPPKKILALFLLWQYILLEGKKKCGSQKMHMMFDQGIGDAGQN
jgi:hypothetical protein